MPSARQYAHHRAGTENHRTSTLEEAKPVEKHSSAIVITNRSTHPKQQSMMPPGLSRSGNHFRSVHKMLFITIIA